jgi:hypothetical protein
MATMQDFAPGGRFYYSGQHEGISPWKKKKSSLFFENQLERQAEIRDDPDARISKGISDVAGGLVESMKEREARLDRERKEAAAEKFEKSQTERRMPTYTPSIEKIDEEEDLMEKYLKYMLVSNLIGAGAAEDYAGTSTVSIGQARDWPTMPAMFG